MFRSRRKIHQALKYGIPTFYGSLWLKVFPKGGFPVDLGLVGCRVVTTVGVNDIVDEFDEATDNASLKLLNFHGIGTGSGAEAVGDTALVTELTTEYIVNSTRATGTQSQPSANVYRSLATNTVDSAVAIIEHGVLSQAAVGGGLLLDRTVISTVNLGNGDSLQSTYDFTVTAGS